MERYLDTKRLDIDGEAAGDNTGQSVSMSVDGNTVAIGANEIGIEQMRDMSEFMNGVVQHIQKGIDIDGETADDQSGIYVSMSEMVILLSELIKMMGQVKMGHVRGMNGTVGMDTKRFRHRWRSSR